jgi:hypothetical protein
VHVCRFASKPLVAWLYMASNCSGHISSASASNCCRAKTCMQYSSRKGSIHLCCQLRYPHLQGRFASSFMQ